MYSHIYTTEEAIQRLEFLNTINSFLFEEIKVIIQNESELRKRDILTDGEKICLSQERASLRDFINYKNGEIDKNNVRDYKVSEKIEKKLNTCVAIMKQTNWINSYTNQTNETN